MKYKMGDEVHLRVATPGDIPALNRLVNSAYRGEESKKGWTTEAGLLEGIRTSEDSLAEMMEKEGATILLGEKADELLACVYLEVQHEAMYLGMLSVNPGLQGQGIGAVVMKAAEQKAKEAGCKKMKITVITLREELIAFYQRKGFVDTGHRHPFVLNEHVGVPKQPLEFMEMEKVLV